MLNAIIDFSLHHRLLVIAVVLVCAVVGVVALPNLDIDAFPDTTPVQVQINTNAPSLNPEEIERQITFPIEQSLGGMKSLTKLSSISKFGLSQVTVTFQDNVDVYFARQLINERLSTVELPDGVQRPRMGPVSTGLGEIFHYLLTPKYDLSALSDEERVDKLTELRSLHDWVVRPMMKTVKGTAEINSWGGYEKQFQVRIDPTQIVSYGLTFDQVIEAVEKNNRNVGGGSVTIEGRMLLVHAMGRVSDLEEIGNIQVTAIDGVPIRVNDVADIVVGHEVRRGAVTAGGNGEAVLGLGFMLMGENSHDVTTALRSRLEEVRAILPPDVRLEVVYDRAELVNHVIDTARKNLFEGGLLVIAVLFAFLGNLRAALIVALAIPLSMLFAFAGMYRFGIAASLLSLGAIDFGMVVDSSVVMVENCVRHIAEGDGREKSRLEIVRDAAIEVRKPTLFGELIIMIVYLPILTLEGVEGKLYRPMALTVIFALAGSMVLSLTLMPVLASLFLPRRLEDRPTLLMNLAHRIHAPILKACMEQRFAVFIFGVCLLVTAFGMIAPNLGREFKPRLSEGALVINVIRLPGTDLDESLRQNTIIEKTILAAFPDEVEHVWSRVGTAEVATDPMGVEMTDLFVTLKPREQWSARVRTQAELTDLLEQELRKLPGHKLSFLQPIEHNMNQMLSGVREEIGVKLYGDDFDVLTAKAREIERVLRSIDGSKDVNTARITGQPLLQVKVKQDELARYGVPAKAVLDLVESIAGKPLGDIVEGQRRFPLTARLPERYLHDPQSLKSAPIALPSGEQVPLSRLAEVNEAEGPATIEREWGRRRITITCNVRDRDIVGFVEEARDKVEREVTLPSGGSYHVEWGGEFENYNRALLRLYIVVPSAALLIFLLLYFTYGNIVDAVRVFSGIPFGWVGGIFALWLRDMPFSISAAVGFIALSGVAVLDDMILVSYIRQLRRKGLSVNDAVRQAAITRLRPVLMTTLVASLGFLPMALSTGVGAEVQRPLATVVIGGVIGAMVMSLLVLRVLYLLVDSLAGAVSWLFLRVFGSSLASDTFNPEKCDRPMRRNES